jgi:DNA-binding XRE family transcriptional regulator
MQEALLLMPLPPETKFSESLIDQYIAKRKEMGLTQERLDQIIGVTPGQIAKWETGIRKPTLFNAFMWAKALKCKISLNDE